jgi:ATP-dependent RNA helicase DeaD
MSRSQSEQKSEVRFEDLNLSAPILEAIQSAGYQTATPIQARAIPVLLAGRDLLGQAQTGTGKTAAFALPMLQRIDLDQKVPQVIVLTPTRELAIQVADAFRGYAAKLPGLRVVPIYGGQDYHIQFRQLDRGVHVVVGTPGRVMDHMNRGSLKLDALRGLVLDEADEMLQMGFADDVEWVLTRAPAERQVALFSATMPDSIRKIAQRHLRNPAQITISQKTAAPETVRQRFVAVESHQKRDVLARILKSEPIDAVLVFVNTKGTTEPLADFLSAQGHRAAALSGDVPQSARERIVEALRAGKLDVIVATDVAARGLDVQRVSHVINFDLPLDTESYVHRIGRTGRASRSGDAILFLNPRGRNMLKRIEQATRQTIERMEIPSIEDINLRRVARFHERISEGMSRPDLADFSKLVESYRRDHDVPIERIASVLAALAAGDVPLLLKDELPEPSFDEERDFGGARSGSRMRSGDNRQGSGRNGQGRRGPIHSDEPVPMETFRIEVGHAHQVKPANIVGAIANEIGLESRYIGRIEIFEEYSTVDLLVGMPDAMFQTLRQVKLSSRQLNISRLNQASDPQERAVREPEVPVSPAIEQRPVQTVPVTPQPDSRSVRMKKRMIASGETRQVARNFKPKSKASAAHSAGKKFKGKFKTRYGQRTAR